MKDYSEIIPRLIQEIIEAEDPAELKMAQEKLKSIKLLSSLNLNEVKRELQELKKQIDLGELISRETVEELLAERAVFVKESLYALPRQMAIILEGKDRREIMSILRKAIDKILEKYTEPLEDQIKEMQDEPENIDVG